MRRESPAANPNPSNACVAGGTRRPGDAGGWPRLGAPPIGVVATPSIVVCLIAGFFALEFRLLPSAEVQAYVAESRAPHDATHDRSIYLVKHAFHTSISLRTADLDPRPAGPIQRPTPGPGSTSAWETPATSARRKRRSR